METETTNIHRYEACRRMNSNHSHREADWSQMLNEKNISRDVIPGIMCGYNLLRSITLRNTMVRSSFPVLPSVLFFSLPCSPWWWILFFCLGATPPPPRCLRACKSVHSLVCLSSYFLAFYAFHFSFFLPLFEFDLAVVLFNVFFLRCLLGFSGDSFIALSPFLFWSEVWGIRFVQFIVWYYLYFFFSSFFSSWGNTNLPLQIFLEPVLTTDCIVVAMGWCENNSNVQLTKLGKIHSTFLVLSYAWYVCKFQYEHIIHNLCDQYMIWRFDMTWYHIYTPGWFM